MVTLTKNDIRWELANVNNKLNKLLKEAVASGPPVRVSVDLQIHNLRAERDRLQAALRDA